LEKSLGCPVVALEANKGKGIKELKQVIIDHHFEQPSFDIFPQAIKETISIISSHIPESDKPIQSWIATRLLEDDVFVRQFVPADILQKIPTYQKQIQTTLGEDADILLADARYRFIHSVIANCLVKSGELKKTITARID